MGEHLRSVSGGHSFPHGMYGEHLPWWSDNSREKVG